MTRPMSMVMTPVRKNMDFSLPFRYESGIHITLSERPITIFNCVVKKLRLSSVQLPHRTSLLHCAPPSVVRTSKNLL